MSPPPITILGPQRDRPITRKAVDDLADDGPAVLVTAGWQEREGEAAELAEHLGREVLELRLHARTEEVFGEDDELFRAHRARQDRLRALQTLYRYRLDFAMQPARELLARKQGPGELLEPEREAAIEAVRVLDRHLLERVAEINGALEAELKVAERPAIVRHRGELGALLDDARALLIAGGHVAALLIRLRFFDVAGLARERGLPIVAWSAGAMVCGGPIVLFHDSPPQGAGNAEVVETGLGLFPGVVPLPHAATRLHLDDPARVALLARRFAHHHCVPLDAGDSLTYRDGRWHLPAGTRRLTVRGGVVTREEPS